jgi:hypothetical protein
MSLAAAGRLKLLAGAVVALTFVAGGMAGAFVYRQAHDRDVEARRAAAERREPECPQRRTEADERMRALRPYRDLGLTEEQADRIWAVVESSRQRMDSVWQSARPQMDANLEQTRSAVRAILTDDQRSRLDARRAERVKRDSLRREELRQRCGEPIGAPSPAGGGPRGQRGS